MQLSVCIITYNHEAYIEQAINSVLAQRTDFPFEIIIGQDASTDSTAMVIDRLVAENPGRLAVMHRKENLGIQRNLLQTLEKCSGKYIAFLEGDDFWTMDTKLQQQVDFLERHVDVSFCFHRSRSLDESGATSEFVVPASDPPTISSIDFLLGATNPVALASVVARKLWLPSFPSWFTKLKLADWPLCLMVARRGGIGYLPKEMSRYRVHGAGFWSQMDPLLKVLYTIQMLLRVSSILEDEHTIKLRHQAIGLADWWSGELIRDTSVSLREMITRAAGLQDIELLAFLLLRTVSRAREVEFVGRWFEGQWRRSSAPPFTDKRIATEERAD